LFRGKAYCEASIYLYSKPNEQHEELVHRANTLKNVRSNTVKVTDVRIIKTNNNENHNERVTSISVMAEVLVKYDSNITHLNDYRVNACRELRRHFPRSGAIMAHSIDTYSPFRLDGFTGR
jgi:arginine deiminase